MAVAKGIDRELARMLACESLLDPAFRAVLADWLKEHGRENDVPLLFQAGEDDWRLAWPNTAAAELIDVCGSRWVYVADNRNAAALQLILDGKLTNGNAVTVNLGAKRWGGLILRLRPCGDDTRFTDCDGTRWRSLDGWWYAE